MVMEADLSNGTRETGVKPMGERTNGNRCPDSNWTRRRWLGTLLLGGGLCLGRASQGAEDVADEVAQVQDRARKAGLGPFKSSVDGNYLGIGDAPDPYRIEALKRCRAL